jgi:hypothetical protein
MAQEIGQLRVAMLGDEPLAVVVGLALEAAEPRAAWR